LSISALRGRDVRSVAPSDSVPQSTSRPAIAGLFSRTAAAGGSRAPRVDPWKLKPSREPTVRTGPLAEAQRMRVSINNTRGVGPSANVPQSTSSPVIAGLSARTAAAGGSGPPRVDPWKLKPYREPTVRTGPLAGAQRMRSSINNTIDVDPPFAGRYGTRVTCRALSLAWLTTPKFVDEVVNANRVKSFFSAGEGLRAVDALLDRAEEQSPAARALMNDGGFGNYVHDLAGHMAAHGLKEADTLLVTPNHAIGLKLARMGGEKGDRFVLSAYDPNASGVQIKVQDLDVSNPAGLRALRLSQMFPDIGQSFPPETPADQMCFKAMSMNGIELGAGRGLAYVSDPAGLHSGAAVALALQDSAPDQLASVASALVQQGLTGGAALNAVSGTRHAGHTAFYSASQKGTPHAQAYAELMRDLGIPRDEACRLMTGQRPGSSDVPAVHMAARRNGCAFIESFGRGLAALGLEPQVAGPLLRGQGPDHTALGTAAKYGNADFVRSLGRAMRDAGLQGRDAARLMEGRYHGDRALSIAVRNGDAAFVKSHLETLGSLSIDHADLVRLLKATSWEVQRTPNTNVRAAFAAGLRSLRLRPSDLQ
jgi:hypothetical protein